MASKSEKQKFNSLFKIHVSINLIGTDSGVNDYWSLKYKGMPIMNFVGSKDSILEQVKNTLEHEDTIFILNHIDSDVLILNEMEEAGIKPKFIL